MRLACFSTAGSSRKMMSRKPIASLERDDRLVAAGGAGLRRGGSGVLPCHCTLMTEPLDYRSAGVDLQTYAETISRIGPHLRRTYTPRVIEWKNGFAGLFRLDDQIGLLSRTYRDPVLVASTDGVGTKLKLAFATGRHSTVGIDLVAMSVNDCLCAGAEPLFFLDYVAMSRDDPELTEPDRRGGQRRLHRGGVCPAGGRDGDSARLLQGRGIRPGRVLRRRGRA